MILVPDLLDRFRHARPSGIFLDFDGTLSEIVARPELARPLPEVPPLLAGLARTYEVVAVVSGRPAGEIRNVLGAAEVEVVGLYGFQENGAGHHSIQAARQEVVRAAEEVTGAWVEDKGASLAVHYREAVDPEMAKGRLERTLQAIAGRHGLRLLRGKMVIEVARGAVPGKGEVVARIARDRTLGGCLYAGDDSADLDAFVALDDLGRAGLVTVKVAVRSEETPGELLRAADVVVDRPAGLVKLLGDLTENAEP